MCVCMECVVYASQTWCLTAEGIQRIEAMEMWIRKIIEKINRTDCISNKEVLQKVDEKRQLVNLIRERQARWIGHVMRGDP